MEVGDDRKSCWPPCRQAEEGAMESFSSGEVMEEMPPDGRQEVFGSCSRVLKSSPHVPPSPSSRAFPTLSLLVAHASLSPMYSAHLSLNLRVCSFQPRPTRRTMTA